MPERPMYLIISWLEVPAVMAASHAAETAVGDSTMKLNGKSMKKAMIVSTAYLTKKE